MRRHQLEDLIKEGHVNSGYANDFHILVPAREMPGVLTILAHLKASGFVTDYSRRDGQGVCPDTCVMIYGYNG